MIAEKEPHDVAHSMQGNTETIQEVKRILFEHARKMQ